MNKVKRTITEEMEVVLLRDDRLYRMMWDPRTSQRRRNAIERIRNNLFTERKRLRWVLIDEERDAMWPNGLPAHP